MPAEFLVELPGIFIVQILRDQPVAATQLWIAEDALRIRYVGAANCIGYDLAIWKKCAGLRIETVIVLGGPQEIAIVRTAKKTSLWA